MSDFAATGLNDELVKAVTELGFESPTPIQAKAIPILLDSDRDLVALAQTGTGKTAAFGLPALHKIDTNSRDTQVIILCPTRELAIQITRDLESYAKYARQIKIMAAYGGTSIEPQLRALRNGVHVLVGTPGRTRDLLKRKKLRLDAIQTVILDEADEMLTMGFKEELDAILSQTPEEKQTLLFSATISNEVSRIAKQYMTDAEEISVARVNAGASTVEHWYYYVMARDKYETLKRIADVNPDIYGIVFCRTRRETQDIAARLMSDGYNADVLNGDLSQAQRDEVMNRFRTRHLQILVATDVAARGLDVTDLTHVINYNLPDDPEVYVHRSGRTGRAGKSGISIAIIHSREKRKMRDAERKGGIKFQRKSVPTGREICQVQLMKVIDKIQEVEVNEKEIGPFLPDIYAKLEDMDREELIRRFVSTEFNRFLEYYKTARNLDGNEDSSRGRKDRSERRSDRGRDRRANNRSNREQSERRIKNDSEKPFRPTRTSVRNAKFAKVVVSMGSNQKMHPARLIGLINNTLDSSDATIGRINIQDKVSYFEIEKEYADKLIQGLRGQVVDGQKLMADTSEGAPMPAKKGKGRKPKPFNPNRPENFKKRKKKARHRKGGGSKKR